MFDTPISFLPCWMDNFKIVIENWGIEKILYIYIYIENKVARMSLHILFEANNRD